MSASAQAADVRVSPYMWVARLASATIVGGVAVYGAVSEVWPATLSQLISATPLFVFHVVSLFPGLILIGGPLLVFVMGPLSFAILSHKHPIRLVSFAILLVGIISIPMLLLDSRGDDSTFANGVTYSLLCMTAGAVIAVLEIFVLPERLVALLSSLIAATCTVVCYLVLVAAAAITA